MMSRRFFYNSIAALLVLLFWAVFPVIAISETLPSTALTAIIEQFKQDILDEGYCTKVTVINVGWYSTYTEIQAVWCDTYGTCVNASRMNREEITSPDGQYTLGTAKIKTSESYDGQGNLNRCPGHFLGHQKGNGAVRAVIPYGFLDSPKGWVVTHLPLKENE